MIGMSVVCKECDKAIVMPFSLLTCNVRAIAIVMPRRIMLGVERLC